MRLIPLLIFFLFSCGSKQTGEIEIGSLLPAEAIIVNSEVKQLMTSSASFGSVVKVKHNNSIFEVELNDRKQVEFVSTAFESFETSDSIRTGLTYKEIKDKLKAEWVEPGFAYCATSESAWTICFFDDNFLRTREVTDTSRVKFFIKRIN